MDTLSLTKEARIYNGEKTISLTSGAGKTPHPALCHDFDLLLPVQEQRQLRHL